MHVSTSSAPTPGLTPTGQAFIDVAVAHGMARDDAIALDAVLTVADEAITQLIAAGRMDEANLADHYVQTHINARFGDAFPTVAIRREAGA